MSAYLYAASVAPLEDPVLYAAAYRVATEQRREKTDRYRMEKDRRLSLGAELLLRHALSGFGMRGPLPEYRFGENGKPFFRDGPFFSLSHSGEYALCAVADCDVGCDVETIGDAEAEKLSRRFFHAEEADDIASQTTAEERLERFYRYWTLKESFLKATGLGMKLPMDRFRIRLGTDIDVIQSVDSRRYTFREYDDLPGCRCALCAAGDCRDTELRIVDLKKILAKER